MVNFRAPAVPFFFLLRAGLPPLRQFIPQSHYSPLYGDHAEHIARATRALSKDAGKDDEETYCCWQFDLKAGDAIIFDYRLIHRGTANRSAKHVGCFSFLLLISSKLAKQDLVFVDTESRAWRTLPHLPLSVKATALSCVRSVLVPRHGELWRRVAEQAHGCRGRAQRDGSAQWL